MTDLQRHIHIAKKFLNRLKIKMGKTTNQEKWLLMAELHANVTAQVQEMREELHAQVRDSERR